MTPNRNTKKIGSCYQCGSPMQVDEAGVSNHLTADETIDYDKDADHVAIRDQDVPELHLDSREKIVFQSIVPMRWSNLPHAHTETGHRLAGILGVPPFDVRVRRQRYHQLLIVVPDVVAAPHMAAEAMQGIRRGSGIVARLTPLPEPTYELCYEGDIYNNGRMRWEDKLFQAASRMVEDYPSAARWWCNPADVTPVGVYSLREDYKEKKAYIWNQEALNAWTK